MNLLVNFSRIDYKSTEISSLTHLPLNSILDFTHNFTLENQINDIINLDKDQLLKRAAREKYVDTIAKQDHLPHNPDIIPEERKWDNESGHFCLISCFT